MYHVGLTDDEVRKSRTEHGVNLLTPPKRPSLWKLYLEKFEDPVVRVLLVAAFFSLIISIVEPDSAAHMGFLDPAAYSQCRAVLIPEAYVSFESRK